MFWHASHEARRRVPGSSDDLLVDGAEGASMLAVAVVKRARCGIEIDKSNSSLKEWDCVWSGVVWSGSGVSELAEIWMDGKRLLWPAQSQCFGFRQVLLKVLKSVVGCRSLAGRKGPCRYGHYGHYGFRFSVWSSAYSPLDINFYFWATRCLHT